jgi:3-dehydroquinate dehydratase
MKKFLMLHGINHNMFGKRDPKQYGTITLEQIDGKLQALAKELGVEVVSFQTNSEAEMCERIHQAYKENMDGVQINSGAWTHYSYGPRCVAILTVPVGDHMSNIHARRRFDTARSGRDREARSAVSASTATSSASGRWSPPRRQRRSDRDHQRTTRNRMISGRTTLIAHLGYPTETFKAPMIYNPYFEKAGIDAVVVPMGVKAEEYPQFLRLLFKLSNIRGALVTMPHKVTTVPLLDEVTTTVKIAGACNAVLLRPDGPAGDMFGEAGFARRRTGRRVADASAGGRQRRRRLGISASFAAASVASWPVRCERGRGGGAGAIAHPIELAVAA